jgi:BirA family biotin operon repressor/biotin-[acetyl-CoA-carboxylase] ligase
VSRPEPRPFDPATFAELARSRGLGYGAPFHYASSTGSTNDLALESARSGGASGSVFLADHQAQGRGRRGKTWLAEPNHNLLFSVLVRPPEGSTAPAALTLAVGLGVRAALSSVSATALGVKWPNDVLAGPRKLAGILCEGVFEGKRLSAVVIGIGINVLRQRLPVELEGHVVALEELAPGTALEREPLLAAVLEAVERRVECCNQAGFSSLLPEFAEFDALAGARVEVSGPTELIGRARGTDREGRLLIDSDGIVVPVYSGTVRVLGR